MTAVAPALAAAAQDSVNPPTCQPGAGAEVKVKQEIQLDTETDGSSICDPSSSMGSCGAAGTAGTSSEVQFRTTGTGSEIQFMKPYR